jgi:hypothetical protein
MRELGLDPKEAARLGAGTADARRATDRLVQSPALSVGAKGRFDASLNPKMNTRMLPELILAERAPSEPLSTRLQPQKAYSTRSGREYRLGLRSIQIQRAPPTPNEPLNVFALVKPRPDFLQKRLAGHVASATAEPLHNQSEPPEEPAPLKETTPQPPVIPVAVAAVTATQPDPTPLQTPSAELDDRPALIDDHPTRGNAQTPTTIRTEVGGKDRMPEAGAASTPFGRLASIVGAACMLAGLLTVGASLSRR